MKNAPRRNRRAWALCVLCSAMAVIPAARAEWAGDYYILIMNATWTYQNADPPYDQFTESVFDHFTYEGQPAVRIGTSWADHTIAWSDGHTVTVYAEVDEGLLYDFEQPTILGDVGDGTLFSICPGAECDTLLIRFWDDLDPALCAVYEIDPGWDDMVVVVSYDRDHAPNVHNAILAWNLPAEVTPPAGAVTNIDWNQRDVGLVASRDVDAESGGLYDFYDLVAYAVAVSDPADTPRSVTLERNFPNPFNPTTTIRYALDRTAVVSLTVHDAVGRRVCTLASGTRAAGPHTVIWRGDDDLGRPQASGTYFCRLRTDDTVRTMRMTLIR